MARELAAAAGRMVAGREGLRALPAESLHVTVVFLGSMEADRVDGVWEAAAASVPAGPPIRFGAGDPVALPGRRPRVFALGLEDLDGRGAALRAAVAGAVGDGEGRRWLPHVTLVRVGRGAVAVDPGAVAPSIAAFSPPALTLFESHPGSRYEALRRVELPV